MNTKKHQKNEKTKEEKRIKTTYINRVELVKRSILHISITNEKERLILECIKKTIQNTTNNYYIVTPNPEMLVYAKNHVRFRTILNKAQIALCDGVGLLWGGAILGISFKQRITGVDFMRRLCEEGKDWPITVGFLGGRDSVAEKVAECLKKQYPSLKIVFAAAEWSEENKIKDPIQISNLVAANEEQKTTKIQKKAQANTTYGTQMAIDILFVAYGFPKQEEWMASHINKVPVRIMMGVGGAFDYISGSVPRAPKLLRIIGLEWFFRLVRQPWRLKRQIALVKFAYLIIKEKFRS
jgi:N-acetylglucosaminyldiphosphoundecaprenol N-acetyl-beta-D-mannosaminyltransferase